MERLVKYWHRAHQERKMTGKHIDKRDRGGLTEIPESMQRQTADDVPFVHFYQVFDPFVLIELNHLAYIQFDIE